MNIETKEVDMPLTTNGTADGHVTVADNSQFYPGAICNLYSSAANMMVVVTDLSSDGVTIGVRKAGQAAGYPVGTGGATAPAGTGTSGPGNWGQSMTQNLPPAYGRTSVSAFHTADGARINQPAQIVRVEPSAQKTSLL